MAINRDKPDLWKQDIAQSFQRYCNQFLFNALSQKGT